MSTDYWDDHIKDKCLNSNSLEYRVTFKSNQIISQVGFT